MRVLFFVILYLIFNSCSNVPKSDIINLVEGKYVIEYFENGNIMREKFIHGNRYVGSFIEYSLLDSKPSFYICFDSFGDTLFVRHYVNGKITYEKGDIIPHGILESKDAKKDSIVRRVNFIIEPPYTNIQILNYLVDLENYDTISSFKETQNYNWTRYSYFKLNPRSKYKFMQNIIITDSLRDMLTLRITDSAYYPGTHR